MKAGAKSALLAEQAMELATDIGRRFRGQPPMLVGMVLADLTAIFLASHAPDVRADVRRMHDETIDSLIGLEVERAISRLGAPEHWRGSASRQSSKGNAR